MGSKHRHPFVQRITDVIMPPHLPHRQRMNFFYCEMDALSVGWANGVQPFLAVFLTRLGATNFQVGLLSSIPSFAGILLSIAVGRFLQNRKNIVPWYVGGRLATILAYAMTGLVSLLLPDAYAANGILLLWFALSIAFTMRGIAFSVTMNSVAGPKGRYALMSRRWSIIGLTSALSTMLAGRLLDTMAFPRNYQIVFIAFSLTAAVISFIFIRRYDLPDNPPMPEKAQTGEPRQSLWQQLKETIQTVSKEKDFLSIMGKRLVYSLGSWLVMPLFTLYYVREVNASETLIGALSFVQKIALLVGYILWNRVRNRHGSRVILLSSTLGMALYPALIASTTNESLLMVIAAMGGLFSSGVNLVFFDELMKTIPADKSSTFVGVNQTLNHVMAVVGPLFNTRLADFIGLSWALVLGAVVRLMGFALFAFEKRKNNGVPDGTATA